MATAATIRDRSIRPSARDALPNACRARSGSAGRSVGWSRCARRSTSLRTCAASCSSRRVRASSSARTGRTASPSSVFAEFGAGLAQDYRGTIERFLALETIGAEHARSELRALKADVFERGAPAMSALAEGLRVLDASDLAFRSRPYPRAVAMDRRPARSAGRSGCDAVGRREIAAAATSNATAAMRHFSAMPTLLARRSCNSPRSLRRERRARRASRPPRVRARRVDVRSARGAAGRSRYAAARSARRRRAQSGARARCRQWPGPWRVGAVCAFSRSADVIALDLALPMLRAATSRAGEPPIFARVGADVQAMPFADASVDLVHSNLCLQWCDDPGLALAEFARVLRAGRAPAVHDVRPGDAA